MSETSFSLCWFQLIWFWFSIRLLLQRWSWVRVRRSNFPVSQKSTKTKLTRGYWEHCPVIKCFIETHSSNSKSTVTRLQRMTKRTKPDHTVLNLMTSNRQNTLVSPKYIRLIMPQYTQYMSSICHSICPFFSVIWFISLVIHFTSQSNTSICIPHVHTSSPRDLSDTWNL